MIVKGEEPNNDPKVVAPIAVVEIRLEWHSSMTVLIVELSCDWVKMVMMTTTHVLGVRATKPRHDAESL
jgi:hypothetical protein